MAFDLKKVFSAFQSQTISPITKVVGIDFGASSVKVVELERNEDVISLSTYGELQLGPYGEADMGAAVKLPSQKRIEALVDVLREARVSAKAGVFALPLGESFVTVISLAAKPEEDIAPRVNVEARKYIPVPITDVALEWTEIPQGDVSATLSRDVLLVAIQNQSVAEIRTLLDSINMKTQPSEIELFSVLRAVTKQGESSVAVIDLGASLSKFYVAKDGFLQRLHRTQFGGMFATSTIAKTLNVPFEEAENLKRFYSPSHPQAAVIKKGVENTLERSLQEFKRVLMQYEVRSGAPVGRIVLTGGGASFIGASQYASYVLDREVEIANPFTKIAFPAFLEDTLSSIAPSFTVALGAALRQFEN
jgi:type IV pilus assembly protein PilM